mgnify:FL=1
MEREAAPYDEAGISRLRQWPCQIKLVPVNAPYFHKAKLLIAADCTAYTYADFHRDFMKGKITLIGCPKLDGADYSEKLTEIIKNNDIRSVTILRMEVPCCGGLEMAVKKSASKQRKIPSLAGGDYFHRRANFRLEEMRLPHKVRQPHLKTERVYCSMEAST